MNPIIDSGLIEPETLAAWLAGNGPPFRVVDASFAMTGTDAAKQVFAQKRIGEAVFFDIEEVADRTNPLPHMLPHPEQFANTAGALGIGDDDVVVIYDQTGISMAAARVWWMFRVFGHERVAVLNGGLPYWERLGLPVRTDAPTVPTPRSFTPHFRAELVADAQTVLQARDAAIIDARAPARYAGSVPEPRPGLRRGHIPGSINIPFGSLIDAGGRMKAPALLAESLKAVGPGKRAISYCGSGVTACVPALALYMAGMRIVAVYDGSWSEWGQDSSDLPIE